MMATTNLERIGWALTSPFEDDLTRSAADEVLSASNPSMVMRQLFRILISEKGIRAALGHLKRAGGELDKLTIPTSLVRNTFPMTWHPIWAVPPGRDWTLGDLAEVLARHHAFLWDATLDVSRRLGPQRFVLLSGRAIESLFPDYTDRTGFDTDLWVPGLADGLDTLEVLVNDLRFRVKAAHLKQIGSEYHIDADLSKQVDDYEIDVGILGGDYHSYGESLNRRAVDVQWQSQSLRAPSREDLLVMLAALVRRRRRVQMVSVGDAAVILRGSRYLDFSLVQYLSRTYGLDVPLGVLLAHVDARWPGTVPSELSGFVTRVPRLYLTLSRKPWRRPQAVPRWEKLAFEIAEVHGGPPIRGWMHAGISVLSSKATRHAFRWQNAVRKRLGREALRESTRPRDHLPLCGAASSELAGSFAKCVGKKPEARWHDRAGSDVRNAADRLLVLTTPENHNCGALTFVP
jgi:hypothetical protein